MKIDFEKLKIQFSKINFVQLFSVFGVKAFAGLASWQAWLADIILNKLWKAFLIAWNKAMNNMEQNKDAQEELKKYEKTINDPNSTAKDIRDAGSDFLK